MDSHWVKINEAVEVTGLSNSTLRRYVEKFKNDIEKSRKEYGHNNQYYWVVNLELLNAYYKVNQGGSSGVHQDTSSDYAQDNSNESNDKFKHAEFVLEKQQNDIIVELINQKKEKTPILRHSTFWTAFSLILAILVIILAGYLYYKKLEIAQLKKENTLTISHKKEIKQQNEIWVLKYDFLDKSLTSEKQRAGELKEELKESNAVRR